KERSHEFSPNEERQSHPGHSWRSELHDRGNEVDRTEDGRRCEEDDSDQPKTLTRQNRVSVTQLRDIGQRRIRRPTASGCSCWEKKTDQQRYCPNNEGPVAKHVYLRKSHIRRPDLQRDDVITETSETHGDNS